MDGIDLGECGPQTGIGEEKSDEIPHGIGGEECRVEVEDTPGIEAPTSAPKRVMDRVIAFLRKARGG